MPQKLTAYRNHCIRGVYAEEAGSVGITWEPGGSTRVIEMDVTPLEVTVTDGCELLQTQLGTLALFAPGDRRNGMTPAEAVKAGLATIHHPKQ